MSAERVARAVERGHCSAAGVVADTAGCWVAGFNSAGDRARPWLARIDGDEVSWQRTYGDTEGFARAVLRTADGYLVIAGERALPDARAYRAWIAGVADNGDVRWELSEGRAGPTLIKSLAPRNVGGAIAAGTEHDDGLVLAVDAGGALAWNCSPAGISRLAGIAGAGGNYVAVGSRGQTANQMGTPLAIAVDDSGAELWRVDLGDGASGELLAVTALGPDVVAVGRLANERGRPDAWMVRLAPDGAVRWQRLLPEMAVATAIATAGDQLVVAGAIAPRSTARISRVDGDGQPVWQVDGDESGERLAAIDVAGESVVAAGTASAPGEKSRAVVLRTDGAAAIERVLIPAVA